MRLRSTLRVKCASDNEYATSVVRGSWATFLRAPGASPWPSVIPVFGALRITFTGATENECGASKVVVDARVFPFGNVYIPEKGQFYFQLGQHPQLGGTVYGADDLVAYTDTEADDHSWTVPHVYRPKPFVMAYPIFGNVAWQTDIDPNDFVFLDVGFSIVHRVKADDVTVVSDVLVEARIDALEINA